MNRVPQNSPRISVILGVAVWTVAVAGLLLMPLPAWILDALVSFNLLFAVAVFAAAALAPRPFDLSAFPSLLLLGAVLRLSLGVNVTRSILLCGEAGEIVSAFGAFVAGGSPAAGLVVSLALWSVQFLVVTKGSERVAEVAARFALDALPGRQMSIDADLRAGFLDETQARTARAELGEQSRFHGAMDGAMKFVKGESLAALLLAAVNLGAGVASGVTRKSLGFGEAFEAYTLLAVGDGLAAQLPALFTALAAGLLVTRGAGADAAPGAEAPANFSSRRAVALLPCVVAALLACLPGFPVVPPLAVAALFGAAAWLIKPQAEKSRPLDASHPSPAPLAIEFHPETLPAPSREFLFTTALPRFLALFTRRYGVPLPLPEYGEDPDLPAGGARILVRGIAVDVFTIPASATETGRSANGEFPVAEKTVLTRLGTVLKRRARDFLGLQEMRDLLDAVEKTRPALVRETVPRIIALPKLAALTRRLAEENVPFGDLGRVLEFLSENDSADADAPSLAERVREGFKDEFARLYGGGSRRLDAVLLDPALEVEIAAGLTRTGMECYLSLSPERTAAVAEAARETFLKSRSEGLLPPVFLTSPEIRRGFRKIIEHAIPEAAVLSYAELPADLRIEKRGAVPRPNPKTEEN